MHYRTLTQYGCYGETSGNGNGETYKVVGMNRVTISDGTIGTIDASASTIEMSNKNIWTKSILLLMKTHFQTTFVAYHLFSN